MSGAEGAGGNRGHGEASEGRKSPLTVFPKHPTADDVYYIGGSWAPAAITAVDKRLTDAELAAEFWRSRHDGQKEVLYRFNALPHYDEGEA